MSKFKQPDLSLREYNALDGFEFEEENERAFEDNKLWYRKHATPDTWWLLVVNGRILQRGVSEVRPTQAQIKETYPNKQAYLLFRSPERLFDTELFFRTSDVVDVARLARRDLEDIRPYLQEVEGVSQLYVQSGILPRFSSRFALGVISSLNPRISEVSRECHPNGALVAIITHPGLAKRIRIEPESVEEVEARNKKRLSENQHELYLGMTRMHRYDNPILAMLETYEDLRAKVPEKMKPLVLYMARF